MKFRNIHYAILLISLFVAGPVNAQIRGSADKSRSSKAISIPRTDTFLTTLFRRFPQHFDTLLSNPDRRIQVIYTKIDRRKDQQPVFTHYYYNLDPGFYFYPASTVKFPVAVLALQKLNELKKPGLTKHSTMITESSGGVQTSVFNYPASEDGRPTIALYIKKILLVSDNDAFNRLYEFLGQEYTNNSLHKMGYEEVQIIHRLDISLTEDENRHTNPVRFFAAPLAAEGSPKDTSNKLVYEKPLEQSKLVYAERNTKMGKGFYRREELINEPFDFSKKNRMSLQTLHSIVRSVMFPKTVSKKQRFKLTAGDYELLRKYMSMTPPESKFPFYDNAQYWDNSVKYLLYGAEKK